MGWWRSKHGESGDKPADILSTAFLDVDEAYKREMGHPVTMGELADMIQFVSLQNLRVTCMVPTDTGYPFKVE